jgi:hypothetical protein
MASLLINSEQYTSDETTRLGRMLVQAVKPQELRPPVRYVGTQNHLAENELAEAAHVAGEMSEVTPGRKDLEVKGKNGVHESGEDIETHTDSHPGDEKDGKEFLSQSLPTLDGDYTAQSQCESLTDSTYSEDATDWEESDDDDGFPIQFGLLGKEPLDRGVNDLSQGTQVIIEKQLTPVKTKLVDRLMEEFVVIFNQNWKESPRQCGSPSSSGSGSGSATSRSGSPKTTTSSTAKRPRDKGDDEGQDKSSRRRFKRFQNSSKAPNTSDDPGIFACPFRKHNPKKYSVKEWRICALTGYKSVARLKSVFQFDSSVHTDESLHYRAHLYRKHLIHCCQRCKGVFDTEKDLDDHIEAPQPCEYKASEPLDGITRKMKEQLQYRRKDHLGQTEAESWIKVYKILFPGEENVPHPCKSSKLC